MVSSPVFSSGESSKLGGRWLQTPLIRSSVPAAGAAGQTAMVDDNPLSRTPAVSPPSPA